jgi:hypothetical protein
MNDSRRKLERDFEVVKEIVYLRNLVTRPESEMRRSSAYMILKDYANNCSQGIFNFNKIYHLQCLDSLVLLNGSERLRR